MTDQKIPPPPPKDQPLQKEGVLTWLFRVVLGLK